MLHLEAEEEGLPPSWRGPCAQTSVTSAAFDSPGSRAMRAGGKRAGGRAGPGRGEKSEVLHLQHRRRHCACWGSQALAQRPGSGHGHARRLSGAAGAKPRARRWACPPAVLQGLLPTEGSRPSGAYTHISHPPALLVSVAVSPANVLVSLLSYFIILLCSTFYLPPEYKHHQGRDSSLCFFRFLPFLFTAVSPVPGTGPEAFVE